MAVVGLAPAPSASYPRLFKYDRMPPHSLKRLKSELLGILAIVLFVATSLSLLANLDISMYPFEPLSSLRLQYFCLGLVSTIIFTSSRQWGLCLLAVGCCVLNVHIFETFLSQTPGPPQAAQIGKTIKIVVANVHTKNRTFDGLVEFIEQENPEIAVVLEVDRAWEKQLSALESNFKYQSVVPRRDNFGIAVYSAIPVDSFDNLPLDPMQPPSIRSVLNIEGRRIFLLASHPVPPIFPSYFRLRNQQLESIAKYAKEKAPASVIVAGDLNTTQWSPFFTRMLNAGGLTDVRKGFGIFPTWPRQFPMLYIPIDHVLVSDPLKAVSVETRAIPGSDHLALVVTLALPASARPDN